MENVPAEKSSLTELFRAHLANRVKDRRFTEHPILSDPNGFISTLLKISPAQLQEHFPIFGKVNGAIQIDFWSELWDYCFLSEETTLSNRLRLAHWLLWIESELAGPRQTCILPHQNYVLEMFTQNRRFCEKMVALRYGGSQTGFLREIEKAIEASKVGSFMMLITEAMKHTELWSNRLQMPVNVLLRRIGTLYTESLTAFSEPNIEDDRTTLRELLWNAMSIVDREET